MALKMGQQHDEKVRERIELEKQQAIEMKQLRISAGLQGASPVHVKSKSDSGEGSPLGEHAEEMEARLSHFEGSFKHFSRARD